jgi:hypothetical protein
MRTFTSKRQRRTYQSWSDMKSRCLNPKHPRYASYGGRGITVQEPLRSSYEAFEQHLGLKPDGWTLERIDNDGDYEIGNVRWATYRDQNKNKRTTTTYTFKGRTQTIEEWAAEYGLPRTTLSERIHNYGWDIKTALEAPYQHKANIPKSASKRRFMPKLDLATARRIRKLHDTGRYSYRELGDKFKVSATTISNIVRGAAHPEP